MDQSRVYTNMTIGDIVAEDYRKAKVFKHYGIDFCCGGGKTLHHVAEQKSLDLTTIISSLEAIDHLKINDTTQEYNSWGLEKLIDHIIDQHHAYTRETIDQILPLIAKVSKVHGEWRPELNKINQHFIELANELTMHMMKEENVLFPYILKLTNREKVPSMFGSVQNPIRNMELEHDLAGDLIQKIESLSNQYKIPEGACNSYTVVYKLLKEFQDDLTQHIHLENNILFPKAIQIELELINEFEEA